MHIKWQQIVRKIQQLHRRGEPLNILAVKRSHPELIQVVYAVKPFRGWKQALEDAGIGYRKIKTSLQDTVKCELCGKSFWNLGNHLILKHEVRPDEYLMDYPDAELQSETLRAHQLHKETSPISHWEPCWSREYVLDRVAEYHRRGYPMHTGKFTDIDTSLIMAANRYLGGWNEALLTVGLDPRKVTQEAYRQLHNYLDNEAVIQGIKRRLKKGLRLNSTALQRKQDGNRSHVSLLTSGITFFGSWDNALKAAGVDPELIRQAAKPKRKYETQEDVVREIRARNKRKWPINHGDIYHEQYPDWTLGERAREYFGSWKNALKAAGFDPIKIHRQARLRHCRYPDSKAILHALKQRIKEGRLLNYSGVAYGLDRDLPLLLGANRYFGSWNDVLKKAGLDPNKIKHDALSRKV